MGTQGAVPPHQCCVVGSGVFEKAQANRDRAGLCQGVQFLDAGYQNMSEEDKLFNFVSRLQAWAQTELRRQGVKDLPATMAAADCLVDYKLLGTTVAGQKPKTGRFRKQKATGKPTDHTKGKKEGNAATLRASDTSQNG